MSKEVEQLQEALIAEKNAHIADLQQMVGLQHRTIERCFSLMGSPAPAPAPEDT